MSSITFPAIAISKGNSFFLVDEIIERCVYQGWKNGFFDRLWYFDSQGRLWPVTSATLKEKPGFFKRFLSAELEVGVELGPPTEDLTRAKEMMCALVENDPDDLYNQFMSPTDAVLEIQKAETPSELMDIARRLGAG